MQEEAPLISIIVPVYNVEKYLSECVNSLETQTIASRQIILVDDGSTDRSGVLCDEFAERFPDIQVIHKENGGLASARNAGLDAAIGTYVGFVDSDDYIAPDMYETLLNALLQYNCDISCCSWYRHREDKGKSYINEKTDEPIKEVMVLSTTETLRLLLLNQGITYSACDKLFRRELFDNTRFPKDNLPSEDIPAIFKILSDSMEVVHIGRAKYYYRVSAGSITQSRFKHENMSTFRYMQEVCDEIYDRFNELREEADFALFQSAAAIFDRIFKDNDCDEFKEEQKELQSFFRKHLLQVWSNKFLSRNAKLSEIAIGLNVYSLFMKIRGMYGKRS